MGNFRSIEVIHTFLIHNDAYNVQLRVVPRPNAGFKNANCLAGCLLYIYAANHDMKNGNCTGPIGASGDIMNISTTPAKHESQNSKGITEVLAEAKCRLDEEQMATIAINLP